MKFLIKNIIATSFVVAFLLALFFSFISFRNVKDLIRHNEKDHQLQLSIHSLTEFTLSLIQIEANCRGYAFTGKDVFFTDYQKAVASSQLKLRDFKKTSSNDALTISNQDILEVEKLLNRAIKFSDKVIKARQDLGITEATDIALTNSGFLIAEQIFQKLNIITNNQIIQFIDTDKTEVQEANKTLFLLILLMLFMLFNLSISYLLYKKDISGRKKAEENLKQINEHLETRIKERTSALFESEEKYRLLAKNATDIISLLDLNLTYIYVSDSVKNTFGYDPGELIGMQALDFIHPDDSEYLKKEYADLPNRTSIEYFQVRHKKKDGNYIWVEIAADFTFDHQGKINGLEINTRDISLRKNTEYLLQKNQRLLKSIFDNTSTVIIIKDPEGHYLMVNKQFEKIHNISMDKLIGKTVYDILPVELADKITADERKTNEIGKTIEQEDVVTHQADGSLHIYLSIKFPIVDEKGEVYSICTIATDITEKKKHEKELSESNARLEAIIENAISSIWAVDKNYKLTEYNSLCKKTFQNVNNVSIYPGISMFEHMSSAEENRWKKLYDRAFSGEHFSEELKETVWDKEHYFDISFYPIWIKNKVEGVSVFARDITQRKKTEHQLHYKVNELNTFMYKATHDLRSPLASVLGLVKLAKEIAGQTELRNYFEMIDTSVNRMDKLLMDLVAIVNVTQGKLSISSIDFETMVEEILESLRNRPGFSRIIFRKKIKPSSLPFHSDSRLLYSVLQNIIDNAIKYRKDSTLVDPIIVIAIIIVNNECRISVTDNGIGIPAELQEKVFDMFYRATTESTGTGLGLYIVKNTVEKLGGEVNLKSEENHGTSVFITLPDLKG